MSVRSSPRLRAIMCSDPSGKQAKCPGRDAKLFKSRSKVNGDLIKPDGGYGSTLKKRVSLRICRLRTTCKSSDMRDSEITSKRTTLKQKKLPVEINKDTSSPRKTKCVTLSAKKRNTKVSPVDQSKQLETIKSDDSSNLSLKVDLPQKDVSASDVVTASCTTRSLNVKRKRGRPSKSTATSHSKRVKLSSTSSSSSESKLLSSLPLESETPSSSGNDFKPLICEKGSGEVIDLTCANEAMGDEAVDTAILVPSSHNSLMQGNITQVLSDGTGDDNKDICYEEDPLIQQDTCDVRNEDDLEDLDSVLQQDSDEVTIAQLFDIDSEQDKQILIDDATNTDAITIPSLKRSKNITINPVSPSADQKQAEPQSHDHYDDTIESSSLSSPTEEGFPQPSTLQQKTMRRLARQKQLEESKAREAALLREERLLRRKGILPNLAAGRASSTKRISWKDETDLVELFIYSPVKDDDDDTISVHSNETEGVDSDILSLTTNS